MHRGGRRSKTPLTPRPAEPHNALHKVDRRKALDRRVQARARVRGRAECPGFAFVLPGEYPQPSWVRMRSSITRHEPEP